MSEENRQANSPGRDDEELESLLRRLEPSAPEVDFLSRLHRDFEESLDAEEAGHEPTRPQWRHVIPLTVASCLAMLAYGLYHYGPRISNPEPTGPPASAVETAAVSAPPAETVTPPPVASSGPTLERFEPVSAQGFLVESSSQGVVETEDGLRERMNLEYRHAYHWRDPETGTNIRYFHPEKRELTVPLQTD